MNKKDVYNLTNPQKNIWNMEQYYNGTPINNICGSVIIKENTDLGILSQAINKFIENNDSFKIRIKLIDGIPFQYFIDNKTYEFEQINFSNINELNSYAKKVASTPFKILQSQLFCFKLFKLSNGFGGFIINAHHIISDAATFAMVGKEIMSNYFKIKNNEDIPSKEYSYVDYIKSEKEYLYSNRFKKDQTYWNELFNDIPSCVTIPSLKNNKDSIKADRLEFKFDQKLLSSINNFCKTNKISIYNFLIAIYSIYIGKINLSNSFTLGTPVLNRSTYAEKNTSGMFISTSLLKISTENNPTFTDFSQMIAKNSLSMLKHQKYDYQYILNDLREKKQDVPNLYDIVLSYQITKATDTSLSIPYESTWYMTPFISNSMNIHFHDNNNEGTLIINYDYKTCKYEKDDILNMHNRILYIINQVLNNNTIKLNNVQITTPQEKSKILYDFNNTSVKFDETKNLIDIFEKQVKKSPNNTAVVFEGKKLTYKELNKKANILANYLKGLGVTNNDTICITLNRSFELIISIFAVIKSGASYVLISPDFPKERIDYIIADSKSDYCIVNNLTEKIINNTMCINIETIDYSKSSINAISQESLNDNLCIIYTSGSTGNPKGVLLHKHGFVNLIYAFDKEMKISKYRNFLGIATVSFDMFAVEVFSSILFGNTLILANEEEQKNPIELSKLIKINNVDFFITTPSRVELLLSKNCNNPLKNIKAFQLGGEKFTSKLYNKLRKSTNAKIYNGYGPTEITACCTNKFVDSPNITIGKPIENVQAYICDKKINLMPPGVAGEICIAGSGVSNGYLNNSQKTSESFVHNPFGKGFLYKTGDLGAYTENGEIQYLGRLDNQIKLHGLRIELEEIENVINELNYINSCIVVKKVNSKSREYLCAYFTSNTKVDVSEIRNNLEKVLPKYMVPSYFIQLDILPITSNGKIDKSQLPEPKYTSISKNISLPRNEIDKALKELYKQLLDIDNLSIDDNFFELGGDSLSAINLCVQIQEKMNVQLFIKDIINNPTIRALSDTINKSNKIFKKNQIKKISNQDYYETSSAQKRIFFATKLAGDDSIIYNTPGGIILDGIIDANKLEYCIQTLINRHESLRTYFELYNEEVVQKIIENYDFKLDKVKNANFENIDDYFKVFVKPFDLSKAPLFRTEYLSFSNGKSAFFIDMHHIICDGTSMSIFIDELCKLYNGTDIPEVKLTYKDYSKYENNLLLSGALQNAENYWLNQFSGEIPVLNIPTKKTRPAVRKYEGKKYHAFINDDTSKKIEHISNKLKITPYMVLLACYYILLYKYTSQKELVIGTPVANRTLPQISSIIGMFVNTLALKTRIDDNSTFKDFVCNIKDNLLESYNYQNYPFNELINKLNIKRDTSRNPIFDTMFTYQNNGYLDISFGNIKTTYYIPDTSIAKYDLSLEAVPVSEGINLLFEYSTDIFDDYFIRKLSSHYINIVDNVLKNIDTKISDIEILSNAEKNEIINSFNDTHVDFGTSTSLIKIFEDQVNKHPDNTAIIFENKKLTYNDLNSKANSLSNYLISLGITSEDIVCISLKRSLELIIAIYSVIKSGASYILLDTSLPKERVNYIVKNSKSRYCIINDSSKDFINIGTSINIDTFDFTKYDSKNIQLEKESDNLCIIYTSGSTGNPKGVLLHKHGFVNLAFAFNKRLDMSNYEKHISLAGISFDMFTSDLFIATLLGKTLILTNEKEQNDPIAISKLIKQHSIDLLITTPSRIELLLLDECENPLENVKTIVLGGEMFHGNLYTALKQITNAKIYNGYGPTEITACCTLKEIFSKDDITIGKPIANVQAYICDFNMHILPTGIIGEICIGGAGVSNGYINNKELTDKTFVVNPYGTGLLYKTGDLGRFNENGEIEFIGRIDNQVKIKGLRIELEEIESIIQQYPNITKVAVVKQVVNNREILSAYYTSKAKIVTNKLKEYIGNYLPQYMVPSYYIAIDSFPYTSSGKIDKKLLPISDEILNISKSNYVAPTTKLQKELVSILEKLLNTKPIGINDNFFELGGDSLFAMNFNVELTKYSKNITYQDIFRYPSVSELENKIKYNNDEPFFNKIENLSDKYIKILKDSGKIKKVHRYRPKNVLITGATGFLGIHILENFIKYEKGKIYCVVRDGNHLTAKSKLCKKLHYYFGNKYDHLIDTRILTITGNITEPGFGLKQEELLNLANSVDLVIHSAANVSHFGNYNQFYTTNVMSVRYIIDFCKSFNLKLYHISTLSVADNNLDTSYPSNSKSTSIAFDESCLYIGQPLNNVYARTKFEAETLVLDSISNGLDAYILRMGNLMPRYRDGLFQENILSNEFANKIISFMKLKIFPDYLLNLDLNFTPIDQAAKAIYKIIAYPNNTNRIFHLYNSTVIKAEKLLKIINKLNCNIEILPDAEFQIKINQILDNGLNKDATKNLINDFNNDLHLEYKSDIIIKSDITKKYLQKRFFKWKKINNKYLIRFINLLKKEL